MRGRAVYAQHCINCHGSTAKGTDRGPDLIRSVIVLRDRLGNGIGPALSRRRRTRRRSTQPADRGHLALPAPAHRVGRDQPHTARADRRPHRRHRGGQGVLPRRRHVQHLPFRERRPEGPGQPNHRSGGSPAAMAVPDAAPRVAAGRGDGRAGKTIDAARSCGWTTSRSSLKDASGTDQSFDRGPGVTVTVRNPLAAHHALLDRHTDTNMHDMTTYLWTLK